MWVWPSDTNGVSFGNCHENGRRSFQRSRSAATCPVQFSATRQTAPASIQDRQNGQLGAVLAEDYQRWHPPDRDNSVKLAGDACTGQRGVHQQRRAFARQGVNVVMHLHGGDLHSAGKLRVGRSALAPRLQDASIFRSLCQCSLSSTNGCPAS